MSAATVAPARYNREACADTYEDVVDLIRHTVWRFKREYGGSYEELFAMANLQYLESYNGEPVSLPGRAHTRGPQECSFATRIARHIWFTLLDARRKELRRERVCPMVSLDTGGDAGHSGAASRNADANGRVKIDVPDERMPLDNRWAEIVEGLTGDVAICIRLAVDMPAELAAIAEAKGGTNSNKRSTIRAYLADQLGWSAGRIAEAFREVQAVLAD